MASFHLRESIRVNRARLQSPQRHMHDLRPSLTVLCLVFCTFAVFLLSAAADCVTQGFDSVTAEIVHGLGNK